MTCILLMLKIVYLANKAELRAQNARKLLALSRLKRLCIVWMGANDSHSPHSLISPNPSDVASSGHHDGLLEAGQHCRWRSKDDFGAHLAAHALLADRCVAKRR